MLVEPAEPCDVTEEGLVHRPEAPRADHRPVVEADRRERASEVIDGGEQVSLERAQHVLRTHLCSLAYRFRADAHVRHAVDLHEAVRATPGAAEEATATVVLEAAREHASPGREQRRADRVALESLDGAALEEEPDGS